MFEFMCAISSKRWLSLRALTCAFAPLILLAGCAADKPPSYVQGPNAQQTAEPHKIEMEDDGQPVQSPPARPVRAEEDDPTQPWSPNYGSPKALPRGPDVRRPTQMDAATQSLPSRQAPFAASNTTSTGTLTRLSEADADMVVAQAINAHEMRRQ